MNLTQEHLEVGSDAYIASLDGKGVVIADHAYPAAHELAEAGWIERYFRGDELCWRWTRTGETALDLNALMSGQSPN
jgi:hypothetical protein